MHLLARHDIIFLGLRGQAKTRIARSLIGLLDEFVPVMKDCEINDNPYKPVCKHCVDLVKDHGEDVEIEWLAPDRRYGEKLATPDVTIADLIGDIDPIKAAVQKASLLSRRRDPFRNYSADESRHLHDKRAARSAAANSSRTFQYHGGEGYTNPRVQCSHAAGCPDGFHCKSGRLYEPRKHHNAVERQDRFANFDTLSAHSRRSYEDYRSGSMGSSRQRT